MIHGIGIDIVDIERFKNALERWGKRFVQRLFTKGESDYCLRQRYPHKHLAVRFAAKVSVFKAMGIAASFKSIEIKRDKKGRPSVRVRGVNGFKKNIRFRVSLSHDKSLAVAETIIEKGI